MLKNLNISVLLDVYGNCLSEKQKELTEYYYNEDLSLSEIAENEGITRQGVRDQIKRAELRLFELEEKCGYAESFLRLKEHAERLKKGEKEELDQILNIIDNL